MARSVLLLGLGFTFIAGAPYAGAEIVFKSTRTEAPDRRSVTYEIVLKDLNGKQVEIAFPNAGGDVVASVSSMAQSGPCKGPSLAEQALVWACKPEQATATASITLSGPVRRLQFGSIAASATIDGTDAGRWEIDGLRASHDERFFRVVVGGGVSILGDDHVNFKTESGTLRVVNDSKLRTSALFGGQFHLKDVRWRSGETKELSALVSLEFTQGTTRFLDGFQFGMGWELSRYLTLVGGFALRRGEELSHGFEQAASSIIAAQQAAGNAAYARFSTLVPGQIGYDDKPLELLDGLPLTAPGEAQPFFGGSPMIESYNRSLFLGVVVPVNLGALLSPQ